MCLPLWFTCSPFRAIEAPCARAPWDQFEEGRKYEEAKDNGRIADDGDGRLYVPRMAKDGDIRKARSEAGKKGGLAKAKQNSGKTLALANDLAKWSDATEAPGLLD